MNAFSDLAQRLASHTDLDAMRRRAREGKAISDALDLLNKVAEGPTKHSHPTSWQHEATRILNEYFDESNPCPVFQCFDCQALAQEEADDLDGCYGARS